jgi:hypothetical protein
MTPLEAAVPGRRAGRTHYGRKATAVCPAQPGVARNGARLIMSSNAGHQAHPDVETADFRTSKCLDVGGTVQPVPQWLIDYAMSLRNPVVLRDETGRVYR